MGRIIRKPGVVPAVSTPTGITAILSGTFNTQIITLSWTMLGGAYRMLVYRRMKSDEDSLPNYPYNWERLTAIGLANSNTSYVDRDLWEGEQYTYRLIAVDANGNRSAPVDVGPITVAAQAVRGPLNHWSEDLSRVQWGTGGNGYSWTYNGATATLQAGYSQVTFSAGSQSVDQVVPTYDLNGRTYTVALLVQGTAGNTFQGALHNLTASQFQDYLFTIGQGLAGTGGDAGYEWFAFTRTFAAAGRHLGISLNTYGTATGRSLRVKKWFIVEGTFTAAQMAAQYQASQGPGSIWQQPLQFRSEDTAAGVTRTVSSWHWSDSLTTPAVHNNATNQNQVVVSGSRLVSKGDLIFLQGNSRTDILNNKLLALNPKTDGKIHGKFVKGDYLIRLQVIGNDVRNSSGISTQNFWGRGLAANPGDTIKVLRNKVRELRGQRMTASGTPSMTPYVWDSASKPQGDVGGYENIQFLIMNNLDYGGGAQASDTILGVEIAYNEIVGRPGISRVEDVIHINIPGDLNNTIKIHDNVRWINWPFDPVAVQALQAGTVNPNWSYGNITGFPGYGYYSGTALMPSDFLLFNGTAGQEARNPSNIEIYDELAIGPHSTFALFDTKNTHYRRTRNMTSGKMPDSLAAAVAPGSGGISSSFQVTKYLSNTYMQGNSISSCIIEDDAGNLTYLNQQADSLFTDNRARTRDNLALGKCTPEDEWTALGQWRDRMSRAGIVIGTP